VEEPARAIFIPQKPSYLLGSDPEFMRRFGERTNGRRNFRELRNRTARLGSEEGSGSNQP
jgi:hypothetical protein